MTRPRRYAHIGLPKCASTSLQVSFFSNHSQLFHLGSGFDGVTGSYIGRDVARVVESDLRFKKDFLWQPQKVSEVFEKYVQLAAERDGCRAVGLSSEFLGFTLGNEIDVAAKASRLRQVLGPDVSIVLVVRSQMDLLRSLYIEMIKGGYPGSYRNFLEYTVLYQDRNWCHDFCYDRLFELYSGLFGPEQVIVLPYEQLHADQAGFLQALCEGLGVEPRGQALAVKNTTPDLAEMELLRRFNEKWPHEFGSPFFQPFHATRLRAYFEDELGVRVPQERSVDDFMRGPLGEIAREKLGDGNNPPLDTLAPNALQKRLEAIYGPANRRLEKLLRLDLRKFDYPMG